MNKFIIWDNSLNIGNAKIDSQHQGMVDVINELYENVVNGDVVAFDAIVIKLVEYSINHLMDEEELMEQINYPNLDKHRDYHNALRRETLKMKSDEVTSNSDKQLELLRFLKAWWINHIANEDRKYVPFLK